MEVITEVYTAAGVSPPSHRHTNMSLSLFSDGSIFSH